MVKHTDFEETSAFTSFFEPRGVAVAGVSQDPAKLGFGLARNLVQSGYRGAVHFVNPKGGTLLGRPVYASIADVPDPVDLAVLLIPAPMVPAALQECGERGIRAVIIASGGFREVGAEGAALEAECVRVAQNYGLRFIGPNCVGLLDTHVPLNTTFLSPPDPLPGKIAFISQSGAICLTVKEWSREHEVGMSRLISLGNQANISETDILGTVAAAPDTHVIAMYLENVGDGRQFVAEAARVSRRKPILALKAGRSASGQRAAASHTGAIAGQDHAFQAAFRRAGVMQAETGEFLLDWARALAWCPIPEGRAVAVLTNAGGAGVMAVDALATQGLELAELNADTRAALQALLPPASSVYNPVDMLGSGSPEQYAACLRLLLADASVHSALVICPPPPMYAAGAVARAIVPVIQSTNKPVVVAMMGDRLVQEAVEHLRTAQVPDYRFPEPAAAALGMLARRGEFLRQSEPVVEPLLHLDRQAAHAALSGQPAGCALPAEIVTQLLTAYGIATPRLALAKSAGEAARLAEEMGFPVVLKIASPDLAHKSDAGGVRLNLGSAQAVAEAYTAMMAGVHAAAPQATLLGAHVQQMVSTGQEVIVGVARDPQFGPLVMFGSGGVEVEGLKDVQFALAPLGRAEAEYLLEHTWAGRKLRGFRNLPPADREAVIDAILRLAQLATDFPQLGEIEINPLRVLAQGAIALDARALVS